MGGGVRKVIGIIGGMGVESTADLYLRIVALTPVRVEQDHLHVIVDSNPAIPDRTRAILEGGESPLPELLKSVARLEAAGVDLIGMACNTAHYWHGDLEAAARVPVLNMVELAAADAARQTKPEEAVGVLATSGTIRSGLYEKALAKAGRKVVAPDEGDQARLMECIYGARGIKLGHVEENRSRIEAIWGRLAKRGAAVAIAGCTEVMLPFRGGKSTVPFVDPISVLAGKLVELAGG